MGRTATQGIRPVCPICIATGRCSGCDGHGWLDDARQPQPVQCRDCDGSGRCVFCKGVGKLLSPA